jgi:LysM repeat protein
MTFSNRSGRGALLLALSLALGGCLPSAPSQLDEEKEPYFLAGKSRVSTMDDNGAVESFERALEVNPHSAAAHFELGCLFDNNEAEPAAAIYHYNQYLKLRPNAGNAEIVKQRIVTCKQELARTVSLGPVTQKVQHDLEQLAVENKRLSEENKQLKDDLEKANTSVRNLSMLTNAASRPLASAAPVSPGTFPAGHSNTTSRSIVQPQQPSRTHIVKGGETLSLIARQYGVRLEALMAANPKVDARRLQVGQSLSIPSP